LNRSGGVDPLEPLAALGVEGVTEVQPVSGGLDTLIWRVVTLDGVYALRLFRPDQRDQCSNEVRAMRTVGTLGMPVPEVTAHGMWGDRPALLMEWCDGRPVLDEALAHPELSEPLGVSMGRMQARMHALSVPREFWEDHRSWLNLAGPDETELRDRLRESGLHDGHPLHLDFHPRNVLCVGREATVVLDWANVTVGDPRADVARTLSIFRLLSWPEINPVRTKLARAWMDGYRQEPEAGWPVAGSLQDMELFEIWAGVVFIRDMEQHIGKPDFWMERADFDRVREYVASLKRRAGLR